jgi:hypothetical protein
VPTPVTALFIQERQYLKNVSKATIEWYATAFKVLEGCGLDQPKELSCAELLGRIKGRVMELQARADVKPISINTWLRVVNAYFRWEHQEGYVDAVLKVASAPGLFSDRFPSRFGLSQPFGRGLPREQASSH